VFQIRCLLDEHQTGYCASITFGEAYEPIYREHRKELSDNTTTAPKKMSRIKANIYAGVMAAPKYVPLRLLIMYPAHDHQVCNPRPV
jgi:hypothetical protein